jgi:hypothetical protein
MLESVKQNQQIQKRPLLSDCPLPIIKNNWKINIDFSMGLLDLTIYGTPCITQERQSTLYYMTEIFPLDYKRPKHSPSRDEGNPHTFQGTRLIKYLHALSSLRLVLLLQSPIDQCKLQIFIRMRDCKFD